MVNRTEISRRTFLGATAGVGAALTIGGCSSSSQAGGAAKSATKSLNVGVKATIASLSPIATQGYQWGQAVVFAMYEPLVKKDSSGNLQPVLAEKWDLSDPNNTIINVRKGVRFHSGATMTAKDVAYSIDVRANPALIKQTGSRPIMSPEQYKSVDIIDEYTVHVKTNGRSDFLYNANQAVVIIPNGSAGKINFANAADGTGPFKLKSFVSGSHINTVANPEYWGGMPGLPQLNFALFSDVATEAANLRSGQVNALHDVQPLYLSQVDHVPGFKAQTFGTYVDFWMPQMGKAPLDDVRVRRALRYCFNKKLLNSASYHGLGKATWNPFNLTPIGEGIDAPDVYDPDKARALLAAIGASDISVPLLGLDGYEDCAAQGQIIQQGFKAAGIKSIYTSLPFTQWLDQTYTNAKWEGLAFNAGSVHSPYKVYFDSVTVPSSLTSAYAKGRPPLPTVSKLYDQIMASEIGSPSEKKLLTAGQHALVDDVALYFMFGGPESLIVPNDLKGIETNGWGDVFWAKTTF